MKKYLGGLESWRVGPARMLSRPVHEKVKGMLRVVESLGLCGETEVQSSRRTRDANCR